MPRIAVVAAKYPPSFGGGGIQASRLVDALIRRGVRIHVLSVHAHPDASRSEFTDRLRITRFRLPSFDQARSILFGIRTALWLLFHSDWDLVHIHGIATWTIPIFLAAKLKGRPVVAKTTILTATERADYPNTALQRLRTWAYRRYDAIIALSQELEDYFKNIQGPNKHTVQIPNGVSLSRFESTNDQRRISARKKFQLPLDKTVLVTVGQLERRKNQKGLIRAASKLTQPICIALVGPESQSPADRNELAATIAAAPDHLDIRIVGELLPDELPEFLSAADIFALMSYAEGLPNSLLEAMAIALPCIASDIPGSHDVLRAGGGILVPADNDDRLAEALQDLIRDPAERDRLGQQARNIVEAQYSLEVVADRYLELYRGLI